MNKPVIYQYQNNSIAFSFENDNQLVNATQMAKVFNKKPHHFLRNKTTQEFISVLRIRNTAEPVVVIQGGEPYYQGTWMHKYLAIKFASWLSPDFELWMYDRLEFLEKERKSYLKTTERSTPIELLNHSVQKQKSKAAVLKNYGVDRNPNRIIGYFRNTMNSYIGLTPAQIKSFAKQIGMSQTIINKGSREIIRVLNPEVACVISVIDDIFSSDPTKTNKDIPEIISTLKKNDVEKAFLALTTLGYGNFEDIKYCEKEIKILNKYEEK